MDKAKKKRIKKYISWISMALVVALLAAMPLLARKEAEADGPVASVLTATVEEGSIQTSLHGGGTLDPHNVEEIKLPSGVKIEEFLVKNGQMVEEGTPLAVVDKVSVMTAITEVSETMEYLREELEKAKDDTVSSRITAPAGGRVKKIFAQPGESVQEVMLRDGALAVLSLDGMMAVKLERQLPLVTGESVNVKLADGQDRIGRVESNLGGVVVITVEDEGYETGQTVTVSRIGQTLGQGQLYVHNAWKATAYSGTIDTVNTQEEKTLTSGATIFTLKDRDYEGELRRRADQHREYEALLQELFQIYEAGVILAPCAGEVEGVDEDSAHLLSAVPESWRLAPLDNTVPEGEAKSWTVMLLGNEESHVCDQSCTWTWEQHTTDGLKTVDCKNLCQDCHNNTLVAGHAPGCITYCTKAADPKLCPNAAGGKHYDECIHSCTSGTSENACSGKLHHKQNCIEYCKQADGVTRACDATGAHKVTCIRSCTKEENVNVCKAELYHYPDCIEKCNGTLDCPGNKHVSTCPHYELKYTARVGLVVQVASGQIAYTYMDTTEHPATRTGGSYSIAAMPDVRNMIYGPAFVGSNGVVCKKGDIILIVTGVDESNTPVVLNQVYVCGSANAGASGGSGMPALDKDALAAMMGGFKMPSFDLSSMLGGFTGFGNYGVTAPEEENLFDLEGNTLMTITPHDTATLLISVDEHDIALVTAGMSGTARVEALKGAEFPVEVTNVAISGTNNGGSSKFAVEVTMPMTEEMLAGMSVSVVLPLESRQVLRIPAAALDQQGSRTLVYTALDEEGQPASPVEVEVGITDGEFVEVISDQLTPGQKIHYLYYDTLELDTTAESDRFTMY